MIKEKNLKARPAYGRHLALASKTKVKIKSPVCLSHKVHHFFHVHFEHCGLDILLRCGSTLVTPP